MWEGASRGKLGIFLIASLITGRFVSALIFCASVSCKQSLVPFIGEEVVQWVYAGTGRWTITAICVLMLPLCLRFSPLCPPLHFSLVTDFFVFHHSLLVFLNSQ